MTLPQSSYEHDIGTSTTCFISHDDDDLPFESPPIYASIFDPPPAYKDCIPTEK